MTPLPSQGSAKCRIVILGSTGSIGRNCLEVISCFPNRLEVVGLSAHRRWEELLEQARRWRPRWITLTDPTARQECLAHHPSQTLPENCRLLAGEEGIATMVTDREVDLVVTA